MAREEHSVDTPLALLVERIEVGATGELVVALEPLETHVFLRAGRIAWATSNQAPNIFRAELQRSGMASETVDAVVDDCRVSGRGFADTLIAWGLANESQVRAAVLRQIASALETLRFVSGARSLFLCRTFSDSTGPTFALSEVLGARSHNHALHTKEKEQP